MICSPQHYSGDKIKQNGLGGTRSTDGARRGAYRPFFLVGMPEVKTSRQTHA